MQRTSQWFPLAMIWALASCTFDANVAEAPRPTPDVDYITSSQTEGLPFSDAVRVDNILFLSGAVGVDPETGALVEGGIAPETRQTLENIKSVLEASGSSMDRVVKCTAMLADIREWPALNEVYVTYFPGAKPARSAFAASGLAFGARVEIECIATVGDAAESEPGTPPLDR